MKRAGRASFRHRDCAFAIPPSVLVADTACAASDVLLQSKASSQSKRRHAINFKDFSRITRICCKRRKAVLLTGAQPF